MRRIILSRRMGLLGHLILTVQDPRVVINLRSVSARVMHWMFCFVLLTSSFDVALVVNIGGTIRLSQLVLILVCLGGVIAAYQRRKFINPIGYAPLLLWGTTQIVFMPFSILISKSAIYNTWLWVNILALSCVVQLYYRSRLTASLMNFYVGSFAAIALFGLYQFVAPLVGLPAPFIQQWWFANLARINAFSYEPSFLATYLLLGWIMLLDLLVSKADFYTSKFWRMAFLVETLCLILCASRIGWLFMFVEGVIRGIPWTYSAIRRQLASLFFGKWRYNRAQLRVIPLLIMVVASLPAINGLARNYDLLFLLQGTGLQGTASHSLDDRSNGFWDTLKVFADHPLIGRTLGGVSGSIAQLHGEHPTTLKDSKLYEGLAVFAEVLAASGIVGFIPFLAFLYRTIWSPILLLRYVRKTPNGQMLQAVTRAMIFEWMVLQFDQNILRPYVWLHITILCILVANIRSEWPLKYRQVLSWNKCKPLPWNQPESALK